MVAKKILVKAGDTQEWRRENSLLFLLLLLFFFPFFLQTAFQGRPLVVRQIFPLNFGKEVQCAKHFSPKIYNSLEKDINV